MRTRSICLFLFTLTFSLCSFAADLALVHAKIYPSPTAAPIENGIILIHDGRIKTVGPASKIKIPSSKTIVILDCHNFVVTAGFWNSHVHILTPGLLHADQRSPEELSA